MSSGTPDSHRASPGPCRTCGSPPMSSARRPWTGDTAWTRRSRTSGRQRALKAPPPTPRSSRAGNAGQLVHTLLQRRTKWGISNWACWRKPSTPSSPSSTGSPVPDAAPRRRAHTIQPGRLTPAETGLAVRTRYPSIGSSHLIEQCRPDLTVGSRVDAPRAGRSRLRQDRRNDGTSGGTPHRADDQRAVLGHVRAGGVAVWLTEAAAQDASRSWSRRARIQDRTRVDGGR
jgi:hypothetical protein